MYLKTLYKRKQLLRFTIFLMQINTFVIIFTQNEKGNNIFKPDNCLTLLLSISARFVDKREGRFRSRQIDSQIDSQIDRQIDSQMDRQLDGQIVRWIDSQIDIDYSLSLPGLLTNERGDSVLDGQIDGQIDRWLDGQIVRQIQITLYLCQVC